MMLSKNLDCSALYKIASDEDLTDELAEELINHPNSYRGLQLWAQLERETHSGNNPPAPPVHENPREEEDNLGKASGRRMGLPVQKKFSIQKLIALLAFILLVTVAGFYFYTSVSGGGKPSDQARAEQVEKSSEESAPVKDGKDADKPGEENSVSVFDGVSASGDAFTCAAKGRQVACVGLNDHGQLGTGAASSVNQNVFMVDSPVKAISAGAGHVCAVTEENVVCWGDNRWRQAADSDPAIIPPTSIDLFAGKDIDSIAAGDIHTCLTSQGKLYCFGSDFSGQLGHGVQGQKAGSLTEIALPDGQKAVNVFLQSFSACVKTDKGRLYCFGSNADKRISQADKQFLEPTEIVLPKTGSSV